MSKRPAGRRFLIIGILAYRVIAVALIGEAFTGEYSRTRKTFFTFASNAIRGYRS